MARFTPFLGNVSGKLGMSVFSSGKGGAYIRTFRPPTNPSTFAQIRARAAFGASSRAWSAVSTELKAAWNGFASSSFSPKNPKSGVSYSGCAAHASFLNQCTVLNAAIGLNPQMMDSPNPIDLLPATFSIPDLPPTGLFTAAVTNVAGTLSAYLSLTQAEHTLGLTEGFSFSVSIENSGIDPAVFERPIFITPVTHDKFGFALYCSSRIPSGSEAPAQIQSFLIGVIPPVSIDPLDLVPDGPTWMFKGLLNPNLSESKYQLNIGDDVIYSLYAVSESGASALIGKLRGLVATI